MSPNFCEGCPAAELSELRQSKDVTDIADFAFFLGVRRQAKAALVEEPSLSFYEVIKTIGFQDPDDPGKFSDRFDDKQERLAQMGINCAILKSRKRCLKSDK